MSKVTMTMQEALAKKKILEANLSKRLSHSDVMITSATETQTVIGSYSKDEIETHMKASFQSMKHLFSNLAAIKVAINASNATTIITVAGKEYTIADAIARLRAIEDEKRFYVECLRQYTSVTNNIALKNEKTLDPDNISGYLNKILSSSDSAKKNESLCENLITNYKLDNILKLVDPNDFTHILSVWYQEIEQFESEIHTALVTSNVKTVIEVELED